MDKLRDEVFLNNQPPGANKNLSDLLPWHFLSKPLLPIVFSLLTQLKKTVNIGKPQFFRLRVECRGLPLKIGFYLVQRKKYPPEKKYKLGRLFIITKDNQEVNVLACDFDEQFVVTDKGAIPFELCKLTIEEMD